MYRAGIIGCGRVAWMLEDDPLEPAKPCTHMGAYRELEKEGLIEVAAACDTDPERLGEFSARYGVRDCYSDYKEMLEEARLDIVSISAYASERYEMVMAALEAGVRGIWCEKAFATSIEEARAMTEAAARHGAAIIVSYLRRWSPEYATVKRMIDEGAIGSLTSVVSHFSGSLLHTGTHAFDVLNWLCGPPESVQGELEAPGGGEGFVWDGYEDRGGRAFIRFRDGAYASVHAESRRYFFFEFDIIGTDGRIRIGNNHVMEYYRSKESTNYTGLRELYPEAVPAFSRNNGWVAALCNLIDVMEGRAKNLSGAAEGLKALETALAVHLSARNGGAKVELPLEGCAIRVRSR